MAWDQILIFAAQAAGLPQRPLRVDNPGGFPPARTVRLADAIAGLDKPGPVGPSAESTFFARQEKGQTRGDDYGDNTSTNNGKG